MDLGFIACFRTPGGHHKFTAKMVLSFAEQRGFQLDSAVLQELGIATDPVRLSIAKRLDSADSLVPLYRITLCNGPLPVDSSFSSRAEVGAFLEGFRLDCACAGLSVSDVDIPE